MIKKLILIYFLSISIYPTNTESNNPKITKTPATASTRSEDCISIHNNIRESSLFGPPIKALIPPGKCQFTQDFIPVKLIQKWKVSHTSSIFRFATPNASQPLNLSTCACLLAKGVIECSDNEEVIRPYTPISTNDLIGSFDLLVKEYPNGKLSRHMHSMEIGDTLEFKHIPFNVKIQAPFPYKKIGMIVGGTGITPMIQALHAILGEEEQSNSKTKEVTMLYGSRESSDILGIEMLDNWSREFSSYFKVLHVLSNEPTDSEWSGLRGFIRKELIQRFLPSPDDEDICIFICGPPPMYKALCGPRDEEEVTGVLGELGYKKDQVFKF